MLFTASMIYPAVCFEMSWKYATWGPLSEDAHYLHPTDLQSGGRWDKNKGAGSFYEMTCLHRYVHTSVVH